MTWTHTLRGRVFVALVVGAWWGTATPATQEPSLAGVLAGAATYVQAFNEAFSGIVAEERYVQTWTRSKGPPPTPPTRALTSDLVLVRLGRSASWAQYRDVFEVDGLPVRERGERLTTLLRQPSASAEEQIARIQEASARLNLGDVPRTLNTPLFALQFLRAENQRRFKFKRTGERPAATSRDLQDSAAFRVSTEIWTVQYEEVDSPTIIGTADGKDVRARGRFWIEPLSGRVLMSELLVSDRGLRGRVDVSYQSEPLLGLLVPVEMRERYDDPRTHSRIDAVARYGRFRQADVGVGHGAEDRADDAPVR